MSRPGIPMRSAVSTWLSCSGPRSHRGGEYVFHQNTFASGVVLIPWATVLVEMISRIASWAGMTPPWWYTPMRKPRAALKTIQTARQIREWCIRTQLRRSGTQGSRKRGSWCGNIERRTVAEKADRARVLRIQDGTIGQLKSDRIMAIYAGPRSWGRFTRKCW